MNEIAGFTTALPVLAAIYMLVVLAMAAATLATNKDNPELKPVRALLACVFWPLAIVFVGAMIIKEQFARPSQDLVAQTAMTRVDTGLAYPENEDGGVKWRQVVITGLCLVIPYGFASSLQGAIAHLPLFAYFPAIVAATLFAGRASGFVVLLVGVAVVIVEVNSPPLNFTLGNSTDGLLFMAGYIGASVAIFTMTAKGAANTAAVVPAAAVVDRGALLSEALADWLALNSRATAVLLRAYQRAPRHRDRPSSRALPRR